MFEPLKWNLTQIRLRKHPKYNDHCKEIDLKAKDHLLQKPMNNLSENTLMHFQIYF